jgi:steroid 5-alpha reductase family enzyme
VSIGYELSAILLVIGVIIWMIGFYFESVGDYQLRKFKKNPENKGQVMDQGLWKYTQHPNYFGEVTMWWGIFIIALGVPWGIITIFAPILITYMIIKVSGVRMLNYRYRKDDKYANYKLRTSAFIPWFPKKKKE